MNLIVFTRYVRILETAPRFYLERSILLIGCLLGASNAQAYIDPGAGGILLQIILGGVAGTIVMGKIFWHRIVSFFGFQQVEKPEDAVSDEEEEKQ